MSEEQLVLKLTTEVSNPYDKKQQYGGAKWRNKRKDKKGGGGGGPPVKEAPIEALGVETLFKKVQAMPKPLIELLSVF